MKKRKRALFRLNVTALASLVVSFWFAPALQTTSQSAVGIKDAAGMATANANDATTPASPKAKPRLAQADNKRASDGTSRQTADVWRGSPTGPGGAFEDPARARTLRIHHVMDLLGMKEGSVAADVGAGGGWFTMLAAQRVGPAGIVYANEINDEYIDYINKRAAREGFKNVRTILGTFHDPKLPPNSCDAVLILNAYHEFEQPLTMLRKIHASMKPGGKLAFIERDDDELRRQAEEAYRKTGRVKRRVTERADLDPNTDDHRLAKPVVIREAQQAGFRIVQSLELRDDHYAVVVAK
jgi:ubiquinone/menaquinone biosynthesis C-methylase UbiE